jgi:predicted dehydrogenase
MKRINRRSFLKSSALAAAAFSLPARSWSQVEGSNSDVRFAVIGFNGRGKDHMQTIGEVKGARITALCDADENVLRGGVAQFEKNGKQIEAFKDLRQLLESKNVDAVSIATPNHWHSLAAIWAIQAGKDVYVEKPVCHNVWEGRKLVEFARAHKKIVQTGTQCRSSSGIREAVAWVREGNLGKIILARGLCYKRRGSIGKVDGPQRIPAGVDYDLWCGPAPMEPLMRQRLHYDWHWVWPTGNGDLGNQGIHQMDIARWFLGEQELSPRVLSVGGRLGYIDDGTTPNTQIVYHDYKRAPLIFEVRGLPRSKTEKEICSLEEAGVDAIKTLKIQKIGGVGVIIECENGYVLVNDYASAIACDRMGNKIKAFKGSENHHANFVKAVHSRNHADLNADILEGHLSSSLCHTGNISYRLGRKDRPEKIRERIKADKGATETFERMAAHLEANGVDITKDQVTLGVPLTMDPKTEKFRGNRKANAMLTRDYRAPYVVPEKVV